jgi:hypothetical protein
MDFTGTDNLFKAIDFRMIVTESAIQRISWKFNPPTGMVGRLVGAHNTSCKADFVMSDRESITEV